MASSAAATELAREGVTLLLLHVPPAHRPWRRHPGVLGRPQVQRDRSRWCPQARISSTTFPPAGTGMSSHLQLDSSYYSPV